MSTRTKSAEHQPTLFYEYANQEREYVFVVKGRPFPCLVSPHLPTPTSSLIDYDLVRDLGLKMTELQCQKFSFAGFKLRILGKVSLTVQCINDGVSFGTFHIKGNVVLHLAKSLDTECVAGVKTQFLSLLSMSAMFYVWSEIFSPNILFGDNPIQQK